MATPRKGYRKDVIITQSERKPPFRKLIRRLRRHHLRQGRPPFVALRHFPRFIGDIYPAIKGGAAAWAFVQLVYCHSELSEEYP